MNTLTDDQLLACRAASLRIGSLCTGYGGLDLAVLRVFTGSRLVWVADPDRHMRAILATRFPGVPNLGDVTTINWSNVDPVDVITAGFPCQDISTAGRRAGLQKGTRSGLWTHIIGTIRHLRPRYVVVENVAALRWRNGGIDIVLGDLAQARYDAAWTCLQASDIAAPHRRERVFILAWPQRGPDGVVADAGCVQRQRRRNPSHLASPTSHLPEHDRTQARNVTVDRSATSGRRSGCCRSNKSEAELVDTQPILLADQLVASGESTVPRLHPHPLIDWGIHEPAIRRWEAILGRPAPPPTVTCKKGPRVAPVFVEWMMGLPPGWVTDIDIPRSAQLRALGNGVIPQQAEHALHTLINIRVEDHYDDQDGRAA